MPAEPIYNVPHISYAEALATLRAKDLILETSPNIEGAIEPKLGGVIQTDSRKIAPGDIFLAYRGVTSNGHDHIKGALVIGASLLILEDDSRVPAECDCPWIKVPSGRSAWAHLCAAAFDNPQDKLSFFGITGTNGKTSTVWMIRSLLAKLNRPCVAIGTVGAYIGERLIPTTHTTPDPPELYAILQTAVSAGVTTCAMEVSSHAICQEKLSPIKFEGAAFTSFSRDHLDFHHSMEEYLEAKLELFDKLTSKTGLKLFCSSLDPAILERARELGGKLYTSERTGKSESVSTKGLEASLLVQTQNTNQTLSGSLIEIHSKQIFPEEGGASGPRTALLPYLGNHSVENFCAALALCESITSEPISPEIIEALPQIPGRLERIVHPKGPCVVVDYAHTPDALEKSLGALRPLCQGKLWVVFGCGGDRDQGKRPLMGAIAEEHADCIVLTSDNPRSEPPEAIIEEISKGLTSPSCAIRTEDRRTAITSTILAASSDDTILIAGKGHEDYQIIGDEVLALDDRKIAKEVLNANVG